MPKSKGRRHQEKKKRSGVSTAVKTETFEAAKTAPAAVPFPPIDKGRIEAQSYYPYLKKELVKIAIVTAVTLLALIVFAVVFK